MFKKVLSVLIVLGFYFGAFSAFAAGHSCLKYAEAVALHEMLDQLKAELAPKKISNDERPSITQTLFLDQKGEPTDVETGIYQVEMNVMEECTDAIAVHTKVVKDAHGKEKCKVLKTESPYQRDCG